MLILWFVCVLLCLLCALWVLEPQRPVFAQGLRLALVLRELRLLRRPDAAAVDLARPHGPAGVDGLSTPAHG